MSEQHCTGCSGTDYIGRPCRRVLPKGAAVVTPDSLAAALRKVVSPAGPNDRLAAAIIQAAKEAERE